MTLPVLKGQCDFEEGAISKKKSAFKRIQEKKKKRGTLDPNKS
jgi:hypothetical protein